MCSNGAYTIFRNETKRNERRGTVLHPVWQIPYASAPDWAIWINMANMTIYFTTDAILLKVNDQAK